MYIFMTIRAMWLAFVWNLEFFWHRVWCIYVKGTGSQYFHIFFVIIFEGRFILLFSKRNVFSLKGFHWTSSSIWQRREAGMNLVLFKCSKKTHFCISFVSHGYFHCCPEPQAASSGGLGYGMSFTKQNI